MNNSMRRFLLRSVVLAWVSSLGYLAAEPILVGTTGDYPPLTYRSESGVYQGSDIQIIKEFAQANHLELKFVATSWQNLSKDLSEHKFTLAVGGISDNPARRQLFYLSDAIESSAKVALIRCQDALRFNQLSALDQPGVIVAENRGGTNQDFALQNIHRATVVLYPQNSLALDSLLSSYRPADVMFSDDVEVRYRAQLNPHLCQANLAEKFPSANKVFLFAKTPAGLELQQKFNRWWHGSPTNLYLFKSQQYVGDNDQLEGMAHAITKNFAQHNRPINIIETYESNLIVKENSIALFSSVDGVDYINIAQY